MDDIKTDFSVPMGSIGFANSDAKKVRMKNLYNRIIVNFFHFIINLYNTGYRKPSN